ncbi:MULTISPECIES: cytochrome d ubiquinol oxidase subunit II [Spongiibacter]|jgi:cytochrome d ubiquinol oxidase subunit II|uniref:cytochrome d ubiquinol oxidase subunit II n=2 Tax=Spongiibacteraceae TaxID=1706375 RepID=UPI0003B5CACA|nr:MULTISPECIES: cytochrome d ubiquinol oxidase subunit II [Spongiibacter]MAY38184.1 cytochrome d ubiquinol oxidase subunit II [Spongiibacter sp.]MBI59504.1 cytochrome d ubiquinol oxidase subunit II [Spongiibacter sp.]|tara:strand:- start:55 stop:1194 length:1140 start_codon:yes stop_codon:yes gene_type:complete
MIDYETLRIIWWLLVGVLLIGFAITDGFDLGVGALLTLVGRNDDERRVLINTIGPHWDGNQVWFITAGGAIFAAWPLIYATAFSGFYLALMLTLVALWMRPLGFDYRSKLEDPRWRASWDWALFCGGLVPALIFGVAFGNLLLGVPFEFDGNLKATYTGSFFGLLTPFALLSGLISVSMLMMHGATWLQMKTADTLRGRAELVAQRLGIVTPVLFILAGVWVAFGLDGYVITSPVDGNAASNPVLKSVDTVPGGWLDNYARYPWMLIAPVLGIVGPILVSLQSRSHRAGWAFVASCISLAGIILTAGFSMFPFLMPSTTMPSASLTVWDATSSHFTLSVMFWVAVVLVPIVLSYTAWTFYVMRGRIRESHIAENGHSLY